MAESLIPHFLDLVADAALKSFWRRRALRDFLRRSGIAESFLSSWTNDETKRDLLYRLFPLLEKNDKGSSVIKQMAVHLAEQTSFPDLEGWEDSVFKKQQASESIEKLRQYLQKQREKVASVREREEARKRAQAIREDRQSRQQNLSKLSERLDELAKEIGSANAGYAFQDWFYDLINYYEVVCRRPYVTEGRQIDGSVTVDGTTYLVELKFTKEQAGAPEIDIFYKKVVDKADNTMGIMVSMSSYSSVAIRGASGPRTPLLLFDHTHIYYLLSGTVTFQELISRVRRHSSQTGESLLNLKNFGG